MRVFLGITGASGAPYAARLVESLAAAGVEVGLCASAAGIQVLATELYGDPRLPRDEVLARFTERAGDAVTVYDPHDYSAPYASGSALVDGYIVCPCSMATAGTIATGGEANLGFLTRQNPEVSDTSDLRDIRLAVIDEVKRRSAGR